MAIKVKTKKDLFKELEVLNIPDIMLEFCIVENIYSISYLYPQFYKEHNVYIVGNDYNLSYDRDMDKGNSFKRKWLKWFDEWKTKQSS